MYRKARDKWEKSVGFGEAQKEMEKVVYAKPKKEKPKKEKPKEKKPKTEEHIELQRPVRKEGEPMATYLDRMRVWK